MADKKLSLEMEVYTQWLNQEKLPQYLQDELKKFGKKEIKESFYKDLEFGTGGLRGLIGPGTNRMNIFTVRRCSKGLADYILETKTYKDQGVVICYDNRHHSKDFAEEAASVLAHAGIKVYLFKELRPTPMVSFAVRYLNAGFGVMVTASHNPKEYNGYKVYNHTGAQLEVDEANAVVEKINAIKDLFSIETEHDPKLIEYVLEDVEKAFFKACDKIQLNKPKDPVSILFSPVHGTGATIIPRYLEQKGFNVVKYLPHMTIDPDFPNVKVVNPEFIKAWDGLYPYAQKENCELILMSDPDADRIGVAVKHNKDFVFLNGNQMAHALLYYTLSQRKEKGTLPKDGVVISTVVTTDLLRVMTEDFGLKFVYTLTGFKFIAGEMNKLKEGQYVFGCEESIGFILGEHTRDKDALQAAYMFSELASWLKGRNQTIVDYLDEIYEKYGYYLEYTENIVLKGFEGAERIQRIVQNFRETGLELKGHTIVKVEDYKAQTRTYQEGKVEKITLPKQNFLKYYLEDGSWVTVRPSGTEPKIKIYFSVHTSAKSKSVEELESIKSQVLKKIKKIK